MALTMLLTVFFAMEGISKNLSGLHDVLSGAMRLGVFSGVTSLLLAIIVWAGWPGTALWLLGLLLSGLNIILTHKTLE